MERDRVHQESQHQKEMLEDAEARSKTLLGTLHGERKLTKKSVIAKVSRIKERT